VVPNADGDKKKKKKLSPDKHRLCEGYASPRSNMTTTLYMWKFNKIGILSYRSLPEFVYIFPSAHD
jgi:hypothetical protein